MSGKVGGTALMAAVALVLACFLPWVDWGPLEEMAAVVGPVKGIMRPVEELRSLTPPHNILLLASAMAAVVMAGVSLRRDMQAWAWGAYLIAGGVGLGVWYHDVFTILIGAEQAIKAFRGFAEEFQFEQLEHLGVLSFVGPGLHLVALGSLTMLVLGTTLFSRQMKTARQERQL